MSTSGGSSGQLTLESEQLQKRRADESLFEPIASAFWSSLFGEALHEID
jgi:hypothetical protein